MQSSDGGSSAITEMLQIVLAQSTEFNCLVEKLLLESHFVLLVKDSHS